MRNKYKVFGMIEHMLYRLLTQISRRTTVLQLIFRNDSDSDSQIQVHVHVCKAFEVLHIHLVYITWANGKYITDKTVLYIYMHTKSTNKNWLVYLRKITEPTCKPLMWSTQKNLTPQSKLYLHTKISTIICNICL